ncbi:uncharacterized protein LOC127700891 [Mytilus californianus]|uniref:uncharacterized protein LOC127700891 n=1 Tax=Mytilus californianus TaxID=6549 RepID=UPI002247BDD7|nr:uncharacterized protein LOC127700891 [Mytilus californianus]
MWNTTLSFDYPLPMNDDQEWLENYQQYLNKLNVYDNIENGLSRYLYVVFLIVGTFGNLSCVYGLSQYCRTAWSVCFYLVLSMLFGLIELYIYCGNLWFLSLTDKNLTLEINILSNAVCKLYNFVTTVLLYFNSWVMVAISVETMITIVYPHRMYKMCTVERARSIVLLITVLVVCLNLHYFWTIGLSLPETNPDVDQRMCHNNYQPQLSDEITFIVPLLDFLLDNIIPLILVTVFIYMTLVTMILKKKDITFDLKKYIVDINTLIQLRKPTVVMLVWYALLKACHCTEHTLRFIQSRTTIDLLWETQYIQMFNVTLTYFFISFKPLIFIVMCKQLRQDIKKGLCSIIKCLCPCDSCGQSRYKSYITPETKSATAGSLMAVDKQSNGDLLPNIKCTNV